MVTLDVPEQGVVHTEAGTKLYFGERDRGYGTLYITENVLTWRGCEAESDTLTLEYPSISLHAISRDTSRFPHVECLYCLLESPVEANEDEQDPQADVNEVRFVPQSPNNIKAMYDAVTQCQELHPDEEDADSDEDQDIAGMLQQGHFYTADSMPETIELSAEGEAVMQRLQQNMVINTTGEEEGALSNGGGAVNGSANGHSNQFEDADDDDDEEME